MDQAKRVATRLAAIGANAIATSDLVRAVHTADAIGGAIGLVPREHSGLRELDVGSWTGLTSAEIAERYPDEWAEYRSGLDPKRGGAESHRDLDVRSVAAFNDLRREASDEQWQTVIIVTHGGVIRTLCLDALGLDGKPASRARLAPPANTSISRLRVDGKRVRLVAYNDCSHL